jgi:hypothetical protein
MCTGRQTPGCVVASADHHGSSHHFEIALYSLEERNQLNMFLNYLRTVKHLGYHGKCHT